MNIAKFLRKPILKNTSERLLLKSQSCKHVIANIIASTQITNTETFTFIAVLILLSRKVFLETEKTKETVKK